MDIVSMGIAVQSLTVAQQAEQQAQQLAPSYISISSATAKVFPSR